MEEKLALINGIGITMDQDHPVCQGIYLKNGFIEKIGTSEAIKKLAEFEQAAIIDLSGQTFLPPIYRL